MVYAIYVNKLNETVLERFEERNWELMKKITPHIYYASKELDDPEFKKYKIKNIVWDRIYNPISHSKQRITVPYTPEDTEAMEQASETVKAEKEKIFKEWHDQIIARKNAYFDAHRAERNQNRDEKIKAILEVDKLFEEEMTEYEIMAKWKSLDFISPPPTKIVNIKRTYNKSWSEFREIVNKLCK